VGSFTAASRTVRPINVTLAGVPLRTLSLKDECRVTGAHEGLEVKLHAFLRSVPIGAYRAVSCLVALLHVEQLLVLHLGGVWVGRGDE
jgi:hypothetical protein